MTEEDYITGLEGIEKIRDDFQILYAEPGLSKKYEEVEARICNYLQNGSDLEPGTRIEVSEHLQEFEPEKAYEALENNSQ